LENKVLVIVDARCNHEVHLDCSEHKTKHRITRNYEQHVIFAVCIWRKF